MLQTIKQSLRKIMPSITEEEMISCISRLESRTIAKHEFVVRERQVANEMAVVFKGAFRMYFTYREREQTGHFMFEGQRLGHYASFLSREPAVDNVDTLQDRELF